MTGQVSQPGPIADAQVGMPVLDSNGERIGTVEEMKLGDPGVVTSEGQRMRKDEGGGLLEGLRGTVTGTAPDVAPQFAEQLLRNGYLKIDAKGLFARDMYAGAEQIHRVDASGVRLSVPRDQLIGEG